MEVMSATWQEIAERELSFAREARQANLDGRSRVSARRAAGYAVKEYFRQCGIGDATNNFYHLLLHFSEYPDLPDDIRTIARHLCQRVDENYPLPDQVNLVTETELLVRYLAQQIELLDNQR
jgi:hypothetical protein